MSGDVQAEAKIQLDTPLDADVLLATGVLGQEEISRPFVYTVTMLSKDFGITSDDMLGKRVGIRIKRDNQDVFQGFSGFITAFSAGELHPKRREFRTYSMRVAPWLALLDQGARYRIFQDKNVLQIINSVLSDAIKDIFAGANPGLYFRLRAQPGPRYPTLQFCVQYGETDFNFVSRLMEQHGIHYFFEKTDSNHSMIMVDGLPYDAAEESPISFHHSPSSRGGVINWTHSFTPRLRRWTTRDRDYRLNPPIAEKPVDTVLSLRSSQGKHFEYAGGFAVLTTPGEESDYALNTLARTRIEAEEAQFEVFSGNTIRVSFTPGRRIRIIGVGEQPDKERIKGEENKDYLITSVTFSATEGSYTDDRPGEIVNKLVHDAIIGGVSRGADRFDDAQKNNLPDVGKVIANLPGATNVLSAFGVGFLGPWVGLLLDWASPVLSQVPIIGPFIAKKPPDPPRYTNTFSAVPIVGGRHFRARSLTPKPRVRGPQTAFVYGQTLEDVATDELGRVRVKFDWDRTGSGTGVAAAGGSEPDTNSCYLRVVQGWAGPKWGMQFLPRVGEEVLVEFIDGDPDRPIITGRIYNAVHKPPFELTKYRLQSGVKTRSFPLAEGEDKFNMLRFDDTAGHEQVLLRSQARLDVRAFGSTYETTGGSRLAVIGGKNPNTGKQGGDFDITVGNDYQLHVNGGHYQRIEKDLNLTVKGQVVQDLESDAAYMVKGTAALNAAKIILEASQKISLKVGGSAVVIDAAGVTIVGTLVKINSGGAGEETPNPSIEDPEDAAVSDTGEPGWMEKHKGGPGGGRKKRQLTSQHYIAPPRPGEPPWMTALRNRLNQIPTGRQAMYVYDRDNVQPVMGVAGAGTFYTPPDEHGGGNTVTVDPSSTISASDMVHEMNHSDAQHSGTTPNANTESRNDFVNGNLDEESHGDALGQQAHNELAAVGDPEAGNRWTGPTYDAAAQRGAADYQAAHPDASQSDVDAAGRAAGEQAVRNAYGSGGVPTGNTGQPYPQYYGQQWDGAHSPPHP